MVTKLKNSTMLSSQSLILAKNHMVTKLKKVLSLNAYSLILAKNHMVTKHNTT